MLQSLQSQFVIKRGRCHDQWFYFYVLSIYFNFQKVLNK